MSKMYHKNLGIVLHVEDKRQESGRITRQQMQSMRATQSIKIKMGLMARLGRFARSIKESLGALFYVPDKQVNRMCENYGHIIKNVRWKGALPTCADCGRKITDSSMLRKAMPANNR
ncbi:MAG: hypothetical protein K2X27_07325 [Candidatus Obscuribacterales bacterium]|nr:hypothetical protein [Candidatus Obscuribacterales bacterium]